MSLDNEQLTFPGFEKAFPSPAHYRIAKKLAYETKKEMADIGNDIVQRHAFLASHQAPDAADTDPFESLEKKYQQLKVVSHIFPFLELVLRQQKESLEEQMVLGTYTSQPNEKGVPESAEVALEELTSRLAVYEKLTQLVQEVNTFFITCTKRYTRAANYAMINAESKDPAVVEQALERKDFRHGVIRLMYGTYDALVADQHQEDEFFLGFIDFIDEFSRTIARVPQLTTAQTALTEIPPKEELIAITKEISERKLAYLKPIFTELPSP